MFEKYLYKNLLKRGCGNIFTHFLKKKNERKVTYLLFILKK